MMLAFNVRSFAAALQVALMCLASAACAQDPVPVSQSGETTTQQLPSRLLGVWAPFSRNYERGGELRITAETLSWSVL